MERYSALMAVAAGCLISLAMAVVWPGMAVAAVIFALLTIVGVHDLTQTRHSLLRNYPVIGHMRWLFEGIRPEIRQYLIESDQDEEPFSRESRSLVYQRSKGAEDKRPFGTRKRVYDSGYSWLTHSIMMKHPESWDFRVKVGNAQCAKPYDISVYNISAMSFGALSANAIMALNKGAKTHG
jgi:glutamate synthase domain-containing protein 2